MTNSEKTSKRLIRRAEAHRREHSFGIGLADVSRISTDAEFFADLLACLQDDEPQELRWGLFFAEGLIQAGRLAEIPEHLRASLLGKVHELLRHKSALVRAAAIPVFILLRGNYSDYAELMRTCLSDESASVRERALLASDTFLGSGEVEPLLKFQTDSYASEVQMGGHLVYPLRNEALNSIEKILERRFAKGELSEIVDGEAVFWWDWGPFMDWWKRKAPRGRPCANGDIP